jgi:hypothetical protein
MRAKWKALVAKLSPGLRKILGNASQIQISLRESGR